MAKVIKVLLYGLERSGKSSLIESYKAGMFVNDPIPTAHQIYEIIFDEDTIFEISEVGGSKEVAHFALTLLESVDAIIFVIDGSNKQVFRQVKIEFEKIVNHPASGEKPVIILINKKDIPTVAPPVVIKDLQLIKMMHRPHQVFPITATDAQEFKQVLSWIKDRLAEKEQVYSPVLELFELNILDMFSTARSLSLLAILEQVKLMTRTGHGEYDKDKVMAILRKLRDMGYIEYIEELQAYKITPSGRKKVED
ncbi:MAG: ADP-ribosylation factor-like protein [Candidatus Hermodarchaeota archaeon]